VHQVNANARRPGSLSRPGHASNPPIAVAGIPVRRAEARHTGDRHTRSEEDEARLSGQSFANFAGTETCPHCGRDARETGPRYREGPYAAIEAIERVEALLARRSQARAIRRDDENDE